MSKTKWTQIGGETCSFPIMDIDSRNVLTGECTFIGTWENSGMILHIETTMHGSPRDIREVIDRILNHTRSPRADAGEEKER